MEQLIAAAAKDDGSVYLTQQQKAGLKYFHQLAAKMAPPECREVCQTVRAAADARGRLVLPLHCCRAAAAVPRGATALTAVRLEPAGYAGARPLPRAGGRRQLAGGGSGTWSRTANGDLCPVACHLEASLFASWTT
eukprot:SAG22_NODE_14_length_33165_cov_13.196698_2_plen_136_part_00